MILNNKFQTIQQKTSSFLQNYTDGTEFFKDILRSQLKSMYTTRELKEMVVSN
jgi:hypothetical protein